ncbi:MAG TPA: phosphate ABC transporter substrate-binding protein PstS [Ilumatobacteraceae bacterium]|nr:phosphate ABC transporter substrate-binding protein PstS [Ilumatobacteraceae bacterium]
MNHRSARRPLARRLALGAVAAALVALTAGSTSLVDAQASYQRISGEGSSWSANAIDAMRVNVRQFGITVDYNPSGSTAGRKSFLNGTVDFAASDIPFEFRPEDGSQPENPAPGSFAYIPVTAGGTAFMYNLTINGQRVTNLRLSGENVAKIFTGGIRQWNDPAIAADNPGLTLPARAIVPVVRSDGSGSTAQFTKWMIAKHRTIWEEFCRSTGKSACGFTSFYPTPPGGIAQGGDLGVAGYVSQGFAEGAIGYVNYSYALGVQFPVAKVLNDAGFYTEPTPENVAVSLLQARINTDESNPETFLTQDLSGVYNDRDPRSYQLSSYSYFILPTRVGGQFNEAKGRTLAAFTYYAMCQAQQQSASLGYSPLPINLVTASFEQIAKIPGAEVQNINVQQCNNPTFSPSGENLLAANAPQPQECDRRGPAQCATGTGGVKAVETPTAPPVGGGAAVGGGGGTAGGATTGGGAATGGGASTGGGTSSGGGTSTGGAATGGAGTAGGSTGTGAVSPDGSVDQDQAVADGGIAPTDTTCDPDTGICGPGVAQQVGAGGAVQSGGQAVGAVLPTTLDQDSGWGGKQLLIVAVVLMTLGLVFVPAYVWRKMSTPPAAQTAASMPAPDRQQVSV